MSPCQLCMGRRGRSATLVLIDGQWYAWALVSARNDEWPTISVFCPECEPEKYRDDLGHINAAILRSNERAAAGDPT